MARTLVKLPVMPPRQYQVDFWKAMDVDNIKRVILSYPRRGGKDLTCAMYLGRQAIQNYGAYWIFGPTKREAVDIYWGSPREIEYLDPITGELVKRTGSLLDIAIPHEIRKKTNQSENYIELINGSVIKLGGTGEGGFVGITGLGFIVTEYSLPNHADDILPLIDPILDESGGWCIINGTQREEDNQLNQLIETTSNDPNWYTTYQTMEDTKTGYFISEDGKYNINPELVGQVEPFSGKPYTNLQDRINISPHMKNKYIREYLNIPLEGGLQGYYEAQMDLIDKAKELAEWNSTRPVYTAWDLGMSDKTTITFFQFDQDKNIHVIDYYENNGQSVEHYINIVKNKVYRYGRHFVPVDSANRSYQLGLTLPQFCKQFHNFQMTTLHKTVSLKSDIELVREVMSKVRFDTKNAKQLIKSLWSYHEGENGKPCHKNACKECNGASHAADSFRYMCVAINANLCIPMLSGEQNTLPTEVGTYNQNQRMNNLPLFAN